MITNVGQMSLIDLVSMIERNEMIINRDYQRGAAVWPLSAKTYFIDSILEGYPIPKIYLYQIYSEKSKRPIKEIVDGQQRISAIMEFKNNKIKLNSSSKKYAGQRFEDLDDEVQIAFLSYQIETSLILSAKRSELLEMFRRMNAYTAPLSSAEKRHATYQGVFKWFIVDLVDKFSPILEEFSILTEKQLSRMADAEFIADMVVSLEKGVVSKSAKYIEDLYKKYNVDTEFPQLNVYNKIIDDFFHLLVTDLSPLSSTYLMKSSKVAGFTRQIAA